MTAINIKTLFLAPLAFSLYSKTCVKRPLSKRPKMVFKTNYRLMLVKCIAECSKWAFCNTLDPQ